MKYFNARSLIRDKVFIILFLVFVFGLIVRIYDVTAYDLDIIESVILDMARLNRPGLTEDLKWVYTHFFLFQDTIGEPLAEISSRIYYRFFDSAVLSVRFNSIIAGSLMVFLMYSLFNLILKDRVVSLFAAATAHFSFILTFFSRHAFQQFPMTFFFLLFIALSIFFIRYPKKVFRRRRVFVALSGGSLVIGFLFHPLMIFAAVALVIYVFLDWLINKKSENHMSKDMRTVFLTVLLVFFVGLAFVFPRGGLGIGVEHSNKTSFLFGQTEFDEGLIIMGKTYFLDRSSNFANKMGEIWDKGGKDSIFTVVPLWILVLAAVGLARMFVLKNKDMFFFALFASVLFFSSAFFFSASTPFARMYLPFIVFIYFLFGLGVAFLVKITRSSKGFAIVASIFIIMEVLFGLNSIFWNSPNYFRVRSEVYDLQSRLSMRQAVGVLETININEPISVDTINKGPGYYLGDRDYGYEFISDKEFASRETLPRVYFSKYIYLKDGPLQSLILSKYDERSPGFYILRDK